MLADGLIFLEGSSAVNLTIASGTSFPTDANAGELFYRSDADQTVSGLYTYSGSAWTRVSTQEQLVTPSGTAFPSNPIDGQLFYLNTNDNQQGLYYYNVDNGSWTRSSSDAVVKLGSSEPADPQLGEIFYNSSSNILKVWNGTSWIPAGDGTGAGGVITAGHGYPSQSNPKVRYPFVAGDLYLDVDDFTLYYYSSELTSWLTAGNGVGIPAFTHSDAYLPSGGWYGQAGRYNGVNLAYASDTNQF